MSLSALDVGSAGVPSAASTGRARERTVWNICIVLCLFLPFDLLATSYEDGQAAFQRRDYATAHGIWQELASTGHINAQHDLAQMYFNGHGVSQDDELALIWFGRAADQGHLHALYMLASMYRDGKGVPPDSNHAAALFREAADRGFAPAQYSIGLMSFEGEGVSKDGIEALKWLILAAANLSADGFDLATTVQFLREEIVSTLGPDQKAEAEHRARVWTPRN